ncbi:MAG: twin-arginine translocation signal domain-containing protein [Rhodospirillales bacterium]
MKGDTDTPNMARRDLLKKAGVAVGAAGVAAIATTGDAKAAESGEAKASAGYRESEHVQTYYELAKF